MVKNIASAVRNRINSVPQPTATTFAFSSVFIPLLQYALYSLLSDVTSERLSLVMMQLEEKEKSLMAAEAEVNALNRQDILPLNVHKTKRNAFTENI